MILRYREDEPTEYGVWRCEDCNREFYVGSVFDAPTHADGCPTKKGWRGLVFVFGPNSPQAPEALLPFDVTHDQLAEARLKGDVELAS